MRTMLIALCIAGLVACDTGSATSATSLHIRSAQIANGELPVPRDPKGGALIGIFGKDANNKVVAVDSAAVTCTSSDAAAVSVITLGSLCIVTANVDRFDVRNAQSGDDAGVETDAGMQEPYGTEPEAVVTARMGSLTASVRVRAVVNAAGTWRIAVGGLTQQLDLIQNGRELFVPGTTEPAGRIDDGMVTLKRENLTFTGTLSTRTDVAGSASGLAWTAKKDP